MLYREHRAGLVRLVERELHDRHNAEDVVQTAFLDAQRALQRGTIPHNPPAWLAAIALNAARRLRRRHVSVEALEEYAAREASRLPEIKAALARLPKNEQTAVLYRDLLGLSYAETAEQMGTTVPAVTMLLHRARSRLRSLLGIAVVGIAGWRWPRSSACQAAVAKAAGVVVLGGGLATAGVVTSGHAVRAAPPAAARITMAAAQPPREGTGIRTTTGVARRDAGPGEHSPSTAGAPPQQSTPAAVPTTAPAPTSVPTTAPAPTTLESPSELPIVSTAPPATPRVPSVPLPAPKVPELTAPAEAPLTPPLPAPAATATTAVAGAAPVPPGTTVTVATPVATVTVSVP